MASFPPEWTARSTVPPKCMLFVLSNGEQGPRSVYVGCLTKCDSWLPLLPLPLLHELLLHELLQELRQNTTRNLRTTPTARCAGRLLGTHMT
ncbi:hypothetical protein EON66_08290 [archaeon]|nr:MAG: hypothetical protein EON66_08290 [archaeon]